MTAETMDAQPGKDRWHLKREIQLGHLLTTLGLTITALTYVSKMDSRIQLLEQQVIVQRERDERQDKSNADALNSVQRALDRANDKLDRLIEREKSK